jgi:hypothetical protein
MLIPYGTKTQLSAAPFPSNVRGAQVFVGSRIASRFVLPARRASRLGTTAFNQPTNGPRTALGSGPTHLLAITPSELACSSLRLSHGNRFSVTMPITNSWMSAGVRGRPGPRRLLPSYFLRSACGARPGASPARRGSSVPEARVRPVSWP